MFISRQSQDDKEFNDFFDIEETKKTININIEKEKLPEVNLQKNTISQDNILIYNTDDYQCNEFGLQFIILDEKTSEVIVDKFIYPDKILIWKYRDLYGFLDIYSATNDIPDEINDIARIFRQTNDNSIGIVRLYPNVNNKECYIKMLMPLSAQLTSIVTTNTLSRMIFSQALIEADIDVYNEKAIIKKINQPFEDIIKKDIKLTDDDTLFISEMFNKQNNSDWFIQPKQAKKIKEKPKKIKQEAELSVQTSTEEIFDPSVLKIIEGSDDPMKDMDKIIGLDNIKHEIEKLKYTLEYREERKQRGIYDSSTSSMHMCFYGSPGTGKTTIARIMTGLLYNMGYIKKNKCVEINGLEFKGGYVGQTEIITKSILDYSKGGILFVDEAYSLCSNLNDSYGQEAVNTFIKEMEDNRDELVIIFAGYEEAMESFLNMNTGFRSRINRYFKFEDYTTKQLIEILMKQLKTKYLKIEEDALQKCMSFFKKAQQYNDFGNGRFVINFLEKIEETHIMNVVGITDINRIDTIKIEDIDDKTCNNLILALKN